MRLSRREVLSLILGAPLAAQLASCDRKPPDPGGIPGALLGPDAAAGHRLRSPPPSDEAFARAPVTTTDVAIVGGGPAGLSAAYRLKRQGQTRFLLLELEPAVGGTSHCGESEVSRYPWGAHYITRPGAHNRPLRDLLASMNVLEDDGRVREQLRVREPKERLFYRGFFYPGLFPHVGASRHDREQLQRFYARMEAFARMRDGAGRPAFAIPIRYGSTDASLTQLDRISARTWLDRHGFTSERLRWYVEYACRDDYGLSLSDTSAWAMILYYAGRLDARGETASEVITWPEGNGALVAFLRRGLAEQTRTGKLVVDLIPRGDGVRLHIWDVGTQKLERIDARHAIVATPQFVSRRIVRALRDASDGGRGRFEYGAWMVANLHLSERPAENGFEQAWDSVLYDSPSLGYVSATHQRGRSFGPGVWTYYLPMTDRDARAGRRRLFEPDYAHFRDAILLDLTRAHHNLADRLTRLDVFRWGHGMVQPRVGFMWSQARIDAQTPVGPVHFAHSDLSGLALFEEAFDHGVRAADEVLARLENRAG